MFKIVQIIYLLLITPIDGNQTILVYPEIDDAITNVTARTFGFVTTSTTGRIG